MQALGLCWSDTSPGTFHETHITRENPVHRGARQLLEAWTQAKGQFVVGRDVPSRGLSKILSGLALYQPILHGDFRVRLAGLALRRRFGRDVTGEKLSDLMDRDLYPAHSGRMQALLRTGEPFVLEARLCEEGRVRLCYELVGMRVFAPDGKTPWVMGGIFFHDWRL